MTDAERAQQAVVAGRAFDAHDADGGGTLDVTELETLAEYLGMPLVAGSLEETLRAIDKDGSSELDKDEFVSWWVERSTGPNSDAQQQAVVARRAFKEYDADDSGAIDIGELMGLTEELGLPLTEEEAAEAMEMLDTDHNGTLEREEFVSWWAERATGGNVGSGATRSALTRKLDKLAQKGRQRHHTDIHTACWKGDVELVGEFISADASLVAQADNTTYGGGYTPLMYAAYQGHTPVVELLLGVREHCKIDATNDAGCSALFLAAQQGRAETVAALLQGGADARLAESAHDLTAMEVATDAAVKNAFKTSGRFELPPPPAVVELRSQGAYAVEVSWEPPRLSGKTALLPVTRYKIKLSSVDDAGELHHAGLMVAGKGATTAVLDSLASGVTYRVQVACVSGIGFGPYSEPSDPVSTTGAPREPPRPEVTGVTATSFELAFEAAEGVDFALVYVRDADVRPPPEWKLAERVPAHAGHVWVSGLGPLGPGRMVEACISWSNEQGEGEKSDSLEVELPGLEVEVPSSDDDDSEDEARAAARSRALQATMGTDSGDEGSGSESEYSD